MRYTNPGIKDALLSKGSVLSTKTESDTGTAVAWSNPDEYTDLKDLGFEAYPQELWFRYDAYFYSFYRGSLYFQFDDAGRDTGWASDNRFYWIDDKKMNNEEGWGGTSDSINTLVIHLSPDTVEICVNGVMRIRQTGLSLGENVTRVRLRTGNARCSNIILADYDCSEESLALPKPKTEELSAGTERILLFQETAGFSMRRVLAQEILLEGNTRRMVGQVSLFHGDTKRMVGQELCVTFDTSRLLADIQQVLWKDLSWDTRRSLSSEAFLEAGTRRVLQSQAILRADTERKHVLSILLAADAQRTLGNIVIFCGDASRKIPHRMEPMENPAGSGVQSITMTLAENTLSDSFQMTTIHPIHPKDVVEGTLLDFPYRFQAEETHEEGILHTVRRTMYDADKMLYTPLTYTLAGMRRTGFTSRGGQAIQGIGARGHAEKIASAMGLEAVFMGEDFLPREDYSGVETTYQSVLSGIFGWTANIPRKLVNIFIRQGRLYFLQRGRETGTIDLDRLPWFNYPSFDRKIIRTTWSRPAETDGGAGMVPMGVYWVEKNDKTPQPQDDGITTEYENVSRSGGHSDSRIRYTERKNPDGSITRADYSYIDTGTDYLLRQIVEVTRFPSGEIYKTRITSYTYTPDGWRHMVVTENGEEVASSEDRAGTSEPAAKTGSTAWRGRPGDQGNEHLEEQTAIAHGGSWKKSGTSKGSSLLSGTDIPVKDQASARMYLDEMEWMDRAIEETAHVVLTAPVRQGIVEAQGNHVMDFFDRYLLGGKEYFLSSNTVSLTPRSMKQTLTLTRWYK